MAISLMGLCENTLVAGNLIFTELLAGGAADLEVQSRAAAVRIRAR